MSTVSAIELMGPPSIRMRIRGYPRRRIRHRGGPLVTNMDEEKGGEANGSEPPMSLRRLLVGIFWNPIGIQFGIAIIAVSIGFTLKLISKI